MDPPSPQTRTVPEDSRAQPPGQQASFATGEQVSEGLVVSGQLGRGATGEVLAVHDLALDREVAMKVLRGAGGPTIARFMREARITARLDHPNVPPVYALAFLPDGGLIFTMRKLAGLSLGESLRRQLAGEAQPAISTVNAVVSLALRVCDALSRAHALGIVHRDVKPDNIMLGSDGEVALVDWGECRLLSEPDSGPAGSTVGTPAYMSPEQARGEPADQRSDIYAIGATFWHVLSGRFPTWSEDPAVFWERKRRGELDVLPAAAAARVPRRLLAILRRAVSADPAGRYATVRELATDIERFQAGQAVAAYRESPLERGLRWLRRHRGPLAAAVTVLLVAAVGAGLLWRERQRQVGEWGEPVLVEDFADDGWHTRWQALPADCFRQDGRAVVSVSPYHAFLILNRPLSGAVAIEYEGWFGPGSQPGDLSAIWHEDADLARKPERLWDDHAGGRPVGYWLQAGSYANNFCSMCSWPDGIRLDKSPLRLDPATHHRFRVELDGRSLRMWVDGALTLQHEALLPISTGRIGLYAYYPGKAFANVRVYQKRLPEMAPVTQAADVLLQRKLFAAAAEEYAKVADSHAGRALAAEARYRQGLCALLDGRRSDAEEVWRRLPGAGEQADRVAAHHLDRQFADGQVVEACTALVGLYRRSPAVRMQLRQQWDGWARNALDGRWYEHDAPAATALAEACLAAFPGSGGTSEECANLLNRLGRHAESAGRFPAELPACDALLRLGRSAEALQRFDHTPWLHDQTLIEQGRFAELIADPTVNDGAREWAVLSAGLAGDWLTSRLNHVRMLLAVGRAEEALADPAISDHERGRALWQLGRDDQGLTTKPDDLSLRLCTGVPEPVPFRPNAVLLAWALADGAARGDAGQVDRLRRQLAAAWPDWMQWQSRMVIEPLVAARAGDHGLLRRRLNEAWDGPRQIGGQRPWHLAGYALGRLDEAGLRRMPTAGQADLWLAVGDALRAELAGETSTAAWGRYLDLPPHRRCDPDLLPYPGLERLAQWLSGRPAPAPAR